MSRSSECYYWVGPVRDATLDGEMSRVGVAIAIYCPGNVVRACHFDAGRDKTGGEQDFCFSALGPKVNSPEPAVSLNCDSAGAHLITTGPWKALAKPGKRSVRRVGRGNVKEGKKHWKV